MSTTRQKGLNLATVSRVHPRSTRSRGRPSPPMFTAGPPALADPASDGTAPAPAPPIAADGRRIQIKVVVPSKRGVPDSPSPGPGSTHSRPPSPLDLADSTGLSDDDQDDGSADRNTAYAAIGKLHAKNQLLVTRRTDARKSHQAELAALRADLARATKASTALSAQHDKDAATLVELAQLRQENDRLREQVGRLAVEAEAANSNAEAADGLRELQASADGEQIRQLKGDVERLRVLAEAAKEFAGSV